MCDPRNEYPRARDMGQAADILDATALYELVAYRKDDANDPLHKKEKADK